MSVLTIIGKKLAKTAKLNMITLAPAMAVIAGTKELLSKLLSSPEEDLEIGDTFERENKEKPEEIVYSKDEVKAAKKEVLKDNGISRLNKWIYKFKDIFVDQDIVAKIRRKYNIIVFILE